MMNTNRTRSAASAAMLLAAALALPNGALAADVPEAFAKLKGSSEAKANDAMARAGYQASGTKETWDRKDAFWWSSGNRQCLRMTSRFGYVSGVALVGADDCSNATPGGVVPGGPGVLTAADLLGLTRKAGEAKLAAAGFNSLWVDEGKPDGVYMMWFNQRTGQCIAATVVGDKFDLAQDQPTSKCK